MSNQIPRELKAGSTCYRDFTIDAERSAIDVEKRTVELAFSSETPVERWWGSEVLDHKKGSVRLDRMKRGGALLMDHDRRDQVGVVESVRIDSDKVGRAVVRFGKSARAEEIFQDVVDGIRTLVSVGYRVYESVLEKTKDGAETYRINDWEPHEISIVSVPADVAVGVGRSADDAGNPDEPNPSISAPDPETRTMTDKNNPADKPADNSADIQRATATGAEAERKRVSEILAIGDQYGEKYPAVRQLANEAARGSMSVDEFRAKALDKMATTPAPTAEIGLDDKEKRNYSLVRALNFLANPRDARAREAAKFEIECSEAAAERSSKSPQGLLVPYDILARDLTVGTPADGGDTVATNLLAGDFIELLRNALVLPGMGAQVLSGLVGNIAIPRQTGAATAYWVAESGAPTESQQAFDQVPMSPKTVGAFTDISRKLLLQSSISVESFVQGDLARVLGLAIQLASIQGGGSNEPTGILGTAGIGDVPGGTDGGAPTWDHIVDLETSVSAANADVGTLGYLTNAKVRGKLKKTFVDGPGSGERVWDRGTEPLNGYRAGVTNAVPSNLTKGTGTDLSAILFGNWADLIIGMWGGLDLMVDPYTHSTSGTVRIVALQDVDVAVRHAESFAAMLDAITV